MKFSLIMGTCGRTDEVERFLTHLARQSHKAVELIVVDQNPDDRLVPVLAPYLSRFPVRHLRCAPGLSRARNVGLAAACGDIMAFPDDDCWYGRDSLARIAARFEAGSGVDILTCTCTDAEGRPSGAARWDAGDGPTTPCNVWKRAVSITTFLRASVCEAIGGFDENLGAGAATGWGAGEETDYLIRALALGYEIVYAPDIEVHHEIAARSFDAEAARRAYRYGAGLGHVWKKHRLPMRFCLAHIGRSAAGAALFALRGSRERSRFYWAAFRGKVRGWTR